MSRFALKYDWIDAGESSEPAIDSTLALFEIDADGQPVLSTYNKRAKSVLSKVLLPLYPLAQWIVANWWPLLNEPESPDRSSTAFDYLSRHSFRSVGDGFSYPDLRVIPEGDFIRIEWRPVHTRHQNVDYLSLGKVRVPKKDFQQSLSDLIDDVLERLNASGVSEKWLQEEWQAIGSTCQSEEEAQFCIAAAYLGLDPYNLVEISEDTLIKIWEELPLSMRHDVFHAANTEFLSKAAKWVKTGLEKIEQSSAGDGKGNQVRLMVSPPNAAEPPWREGYRMASELRNALRFGDKFPIEIESITQASFPILVAEEPPIRSLDAVVALTPKAAPCCYTDKRLIEAKRFVQARALYEFLSESNPQIVLSSAVTAHQQASRAFAAELLAPSSMIRQKIRSDIVTEDEIIEMAADFKVSVFVVAHQILNHKISEIPQYSSIESFE